jgi:hypothetical protein
MLDGFPPDTRVVIADVTWDEYERLADAIREGEHCRIAFDGTDIEMMTLGPFHEREKSLVELFITIVAGELRIERQPMGSTTWKRKKLKRAIESDICYYFDPVKLAPRRPPHTPTMSASILTLTSPSKSISLGQRSTDPESTPRYKCRSSGGRINSRWRFST